MHLFDRNAGSKQISVSFILIMNATSDLSNGCLLLAPEFTFCASKTFFLRTLRKLICIFACIQQSRSGRCLDARAFRQIGDLLKSEALVLGRVLRRTHERCVLRCSREHHWAKLSAALL